MSKQVKGVSEKEEVFHDEWAEGIDLDKVLVKESFEYATSCENAYALKVLGQIKGKKILDLGCGAGEASIYFAMKGADVTALDISGGMLKTVKRLGNKYGVKVKTIKSNAEELSIKDNEFDLIYGNAVLHHIDIDKTLLEVKRVLKPRGRAVFIEPIAYNPVINVYRKMAQEVRTDDEHPLKLKDIRLMKKYFKRVSHREFWFISLSIFLYFYFIERVHPKQERYWKKVIYDGKKYEKKFRVLKKLDDIILVVFPPLRAMCWNTVVELEK